VEVTIHGGLIIIVDAAVVVEIHAAAAEVVAVQVAAHRVSQDLIKQ
jgi:hypothetical protein